MFLSFHLPYETLLNSKSQGKTKDGKIYKEDRICTIESIREEEWSNYVDGYWKWKGKICHDQKYLLIIKLSSYEQV